MDGADGSASEAAPSGSCGVGTAAAADLIGNGQGAGQVLADPDRDRPAVEASQFGGGRAGSARSLVHVEPIRPPADNALYEDASTT